MARPRSDEKRGAIMSAAIRIIAREGLGATTAAIAQEAGICNGSLFTYFETKAVLVNHLFLELKTELATAALAGLPEQNDLRKQAFHAWSNWMRWATSSPEKRRALAQLEVSDEVTRETRNAAQRASAGIAELLEQLRANGSMRNVPMAFVSSITNSLANATMDFMIQDKANSAKHCRVGFDAFWRTIA
jgi:AcrR family transcriptional regulator